jgi:acyl-CoA thioesterase-1
MGSQYTRAVVKPQDKLDLSNKITSMISEVARDKSVGKRVNVFRRFALMQRWANDGFPIEELDDGAETQLHTSDRVTNCVAQALSGAIKQAVETGAST